jgi:hypothetical protein
MGFRYRVQMRLNKNDEWSDHAGWVDDKKRAYQLMNLGRHDYGGGQWQILEEDETKNIAIVHLDEPMSRSSVITLMDLLFCTGIIINLTCCAGISFFPEHMILLKIGASVGICLSLTIFVAANISKWRRKLSRL